jgi:hypothetical protein
MILGFLPVVGDFAGICLSFWLVNYMKNSNLIENHRIPIMLREMTLMVIKDAIVSVILFNLF